MAIKTHTGQAPEVAQVTTITYSAITIAETYTITINGKSVSYVATDTLQATATTALMNAWNTSAQPEHQEFIATGGVTSVILTARATGEITTITADATGVPTATVTATTAASGPNICFGIAANWSGGTNPASGDTLMFINSHDILYGMTSTDDYAEIQIKAGCGAIGLPAVNSNGYPEFRTRYLTPDTAGGAMVLKIGEGYGTQPLRVQVDAATRQVTATIYNSGNAFNSAAPVLIKNVGASSTLDHHGGTIDVQNDAAATVASFKQIPLDRQQPVSTLGENINVTAVTVSGGSCEMAGDSATLDISGPAVVHIVGTGTVAIARVREQSTLKFKSSTNITTSIASYGGGTVDFSEDGRAITLPLMTMYAGSTLKDPIGRITYTAGIVLSGCRLDDVSINIGYHRTLGVT